MAENEGQARLSIPRREVAEFCKRHHIKKLSLFGSVLREDFRPDSDIDVLVEFEPGRTPGFLGLAAMELELSKLCGGRRVDMRTAEELSRYFRQDVVWEAEVQFAQGCRSSPATHAGCRSRSHFLLHGQIAECVGRGQDAGALAG